MTSGIVVLTEKKTCGGSKPMNVLQTLATVDLVSALAEFTFVDSNANFEGPVSLKFSRFLDHPVF